MDDVSGGNCYMNNHILYQKDCDINNGDMSSGNCFINSHTIFQCVDLSTIKEMYGDVKKGDVSSRYIYMNIHTIYQFNGLK